MGFSARDRAVLKLLFPGRQVEIHRRPVTAAEIMSKYPRHCVARPDVFKYPSIVVKPEAVLVPGKVFLIIPYNTLYDLLKANGYRSQPPGQQNQSPDEHTDHSCHNYDHLRYYDNRNSPLNSTAGTTPKHLGRDRYHRRQSTHLNRTSLELDSDDNVYPSCVRPSKEMKARNRNGYRKLYKRSPVDDSSFDSRPSHSWSHGNRSDAAKKSHVASHGHQHMRSAEHVELKSCFRKQDSSRKLLKLKVTFGSPVIIPTSPRESRSLEDHARSYYFNGYQS